MSRTRTAPEVYQSLRLRVAMPMSISTFSHAASRSRSLCELEEVKAARRARENRNNYVGKQTVQTF